MLIQLLLLLLASGSVLSEFPPWVAWIAFGLSVVIGFFRYLASVEESEVRRLDPESAKGIYGPPSMKPVVHGFIGMYLWLATLWFALSASRSVDRGWVAFWENMQAIGALGAGFIVAYIALRRRSIRRASRRGR